jgi:hypothetical protein
MPIIKKAVFKDRFFCLQNTELAIVKFCKSKDSLALIIKEKSSQ